MTNKISSKFDQYLKSATKSGLSGKSSLVYVNLLSQNSSLTPKSIINLTKLHRQYVYDAIHELEEKGLVVFEGVGKKIKYRATSPERILSDIEKRRIEVLDSVASLMNLYNRSSVGVVEIMSGSMAVVEYEFKMLEEAKEGDYIDIIGGAGMKFVDLFKDRLEEWEKIRNEKNIKLRYIGGEEDVKHNYTSIIKNESRSISGINDIVNICVRPGSVSFNIYDPEVLTVCIKSEATVISQKALFEVLWKVAKNKNKK